MLQKKEITLAKLAEELKGEFIGADGNLVVNNIRDAEEAGCGDLAVIFNKRSEPMLQKTKASCAIVPLQIKQAPIPIIKCKNTNLAFKRAAELISPDHIPHPKGIHETACVGKNVTLGKGVALGAYACVEDGSEIGDDTVIYAHCYIGHSTKIGKNCIIYPNVTIRENIRIGSGVIIHPASVVGSDGYGYELTETGHAKIPQMGDVIIEDDVEIGACVAVDRAKISHTRIGRGTKIDNLVQVAHNVTIGQNCIIVSQTGISGSVKIGNNVMIGGQVGFVQHIEIGDNAMIAAKAGVIKSVPPKAIMGGIPARPLKHAKAMVIMLEKLPELYKKLKALEKKLDIKIIE